MRCSSACSLSPHGARQLRSKTRSCSATVCSRHRRATRTTSGCAATVANASPSTIAAAESSNAATEATSWAVMRGERVQNVFFVFYVHMLQFDVTTWICAFCSFRAAPDASQNRQQQQPQTPSGTVEIRPKNQTLDKSASSNSSIVAAANGISLRVVAGGLFALLMLAALVHFVVKRRRSRVPSFRKGESMIESENEDLLISSMYA